MKNLTYLDYNATSPVRPNAIKRMQELLAVPSNPSSAHGYGREAKKQLEDARKIVAASVSAWADEVIFCGSGTEANAMALHGRDVLVSAIEHSSVLRHSRLRGDDVIKVTPGGIVDIAALGELLEKCKPQLVSVMLANNETGVIQPIGEIAALCKKHDVKLHCDAVQALGKIPVDFGTLGADMLTISGHKCGGPVGAAALILRRETALSPLFAGGGQEKGRRAGTENIAALVGLASAIEEIDLSHMAKLRGWMDAMEAEMMSLGAEVFGKTSPRLPNTTSVSMPGVSSEVQLMDFDLKGFAVSAGSACSSGRIEPSHVLAAMSVAKEKAECAIRISGGWATTQEEIRAFTGAWKSTCERLATKA